MAIAFNTTGTGDAGPGSTSLTYSHTVSSGSDRLLVVVIATPSGDYVTGVTYNGVSMTQQAKQNAPTNTSNYMYQYYLVAPATGAHNVVISTSSGTRIRARSADYTGVHQSTPVDTSNTAQFATATTTCNISITTAADNCWAVRGDGMQVDPTASTNATLRLMTDSVGLFDSGGAITPAGAFTMTTTKPGTADNCGVMVAYKPAVAAGPTNVKTWDGITQSTGVKTYFGVAIANVKTVDGVS